MALDSRIFRMSRGADKLGPKSLLLLLVADDITKGIYVTRQQKKIRWEKAFYLPGVLDMAGLLKGIKKEKIIVDYVAIVVQNRDCMLRLTSFPGKVPKAEAMEKQLRQTFGVDEKYAVASHIVSTQTIGEKSQYTSLAAVMPVELKNSAIKLAEELGGKIVALGVAGVSLINFLHYASGVSGNSKEGFIYINSTDSELILFADNELNLNRRFQFGKENVIARLQEVMSSSYEEAEDMCLTGALDLGAMLDPVINPWLHQIKISLDFFERKNGIAIEKLLILGEGADLKVLTTRLDSMLDCQIEKYNSFSVFSEFKRVKGLETDDVDFYVLLTEAVNILKRAMDNDEV